MTVPVLAQVFIVRVLTVCWSSQAPPLIPGTEPLFLHEIKSVLSLTLCSVTDQFLESLRNC